MLIDHGKSAQGPFPEITVNNRGNLADEEYLADRERRLGVKLIHTHRLKDI